MILTCKYCNHTWDYSGKSKYYLTCPSCYNKISLKKTSTKTKEQNHNLSNLTRKGLNEYEEIRNYIREFINTDIEASKLPPTNKYDLERVLMERTLFTLITELESRLNAIEGKETKTPRRPILEKYPKIKIENLSF